MRLFLVAVLLFVAACASRPPVKPPEDLSVLLVADAQVLHGCYDCLLKAREIYERVGSGSNRPVVLARLFETEILIALREKELALGSAASASIARARALASELPAEAEAWRYLALVEMVLPDNIGMPRSERAQLRLAQADRLGSLDDDLAWLRSATTLREPVRQYLSLAVDCSYLVRPRRLTSLTPAPGVWTGSLGPLNVKADLSPLVAYRAAVCDFIVSRALDRVRTTVPQFAEAAFFLARPELQSSASVGGGRARALLAEALARFPESPSVTYLAGNLSQLVGDCRRALDLYDRTLALQPVHEDALLGRTICLTYLGRGDEAVAEATRMIDLHTDNWGEAFYWRASNYHDRQQLEPARADIDRAKRLVPNPAKVLTLAGIIEYEQRDFSQAEADLLLARRLWAGNCVAIWYLGLVKMDEARTIESGDHFASAMDCYAGDVASDEKGLRDMQTRPDLDPEFRARQIAGFEAALKEDRHHQYAAAFNAANEYAQGGDAARARKLVEIAANEPSLADKVAQLKDILKER